VFAGPTGVLKFESTWQVLPNGARRLTTAIPKEECDMSSRLNLPPIIELTEFFGAPPVEESTEDGFVCYEIIDHRGVELRFSLAAHERSVQTVVSLGDQSLITVSHEQATQISLHARILRCEFSTRDSKTTLAVDLNEGVSVTWASLQTD